MVGARASGAGGLAAEAAAAAAPARRRGRAARGGARDELREELRVKEVEFGHVEATELRVKPNLPVLGPKLGKELGAVRAALAAGEFEQSSDGGFRVLGHDLAADEVLVERSGKSGWAVASDDGVTVALDTTVDAELELEGRVYDLIHTLNSMRKEQGLELTDRIAVTLPAADADLVERHAEWIKSEVLAVSLETDGIEAPQIAKVSHPAAAGPTERDCSAERRGLSPRLMASAEVIAPRDGPLVAISSRGSVPGTDARPGATSESPRAPARGAAPPAA